MTAVREYSSPLLVPTEEHENLTSIVLDNAARQPARVVYRRQVDGAWVDVTASQFRDDVLALAKGLAAAGIGVGDRVGLMARTRYEWSLVDFAVWFAGAVVVPIYETSSAEQVEWMVKDSGAVACVVENGTHAALVGSLRAGLPGLRDVWTIDDGDLDGLVTGGAGVSDDDLGTRRDALTASTVATLIYTSGTTGRPKGCELTHGNFLFEARNAIAVLHEVLAEDGETLLFLPLAHVFARIIEIACLMRPVALAHSADVTTLLADLAAVRPTFILAVPRVFEKVFNSASQRAHSESGAKGKIFDAAAQTAIAYSKALDAGGAGVGLRAKHALFDRLVYSKLRAVFGGRLDYAISGGAPLGDRLSHFYRGIGLIVFEGYGLTETTAAACVNAPSAIRLNTVGRPLPGVSIRIAEDNEILVMGPNVLERYWQNETATGEALDAQGWFSTGDLGELDGDGYLRITGRKKELIVTATGKNVAPSVIEDRVRAHPLVSQCVVVGDGQPYVAALITLDAEALPGWAKQHGKSGTTPEQLVDDPDLQSAIQQAIDEGNKAVSKAESVRRFRVLTVEMSEQSGHLTPKQSLKRPVIMKDFAAEVDALYS